MNARIFPCGQCIGRTSGHEERLRKVARAAGFSKPRRATQTPGSLLLELTA